MSRYEKVKFTDGDTPRTVFLRVQKDGPRFLTGIEVDNEGEEISGPDWDQRTRLIDKTLILWRKPYVVDLKYGTLVPAKKAK